MKKIPLNDVPSFINIREMLYYVEQRHGERIAYSYRSNPRDRDVRTVSFRELGKAVRALSTSLLANDLEGKRIALIGTLSYGWICSYLALLAAGATVVPLDPAWETEDLAHTVRFAECHALLCSEAVRVEKGDAIAAACATNTVLSLDEASSVPTVLDWIARGRQLRSGGDRAYEATRLNPDKTALLVFTSGTTGKGKGVMLSQTNILSNIEAGLKYIKVTDKTIGLLPPHHTFGSTVGILGNLIFGANLYISSGIKYLLREMAEQKPGHLIVVPLYLESFRKRILETVRKKKLEKVFARLQSLSRASSRIGIDVGSKLFSTVLAAFGGKLRYIVCGGAPINQDTVDFFRSMGIIVMNGYGITECSPLIACNRNDGTKNSRCGLVIPGVTCKIADPDDEGNGEIRIKGQNVMQGYYKDAEATASVFDCDGYFRTGDIGHLDEDGYLYITGRIKNLIILSNGKNVYPEEIEAELCTLPHVVDVVVYEGISARGTQYNTTVAEIYPDADALKQAGIEAAAKFYQDLINDYNRTAVPYKKIGMVRIREEEFPKNTLRKIVRFRIDHSIE